MQHLAVPKVNCPPHNHNDVSPEGDLAEDPNIYSNDCVWNYDEGAMWNVSSGSMIRICYHVIVLLCAYLASSKNMNTCLLLTHLCLASRKNA